MHNAKNIFGRSLPVAFAIATIGICVAGCDTTASETTGNNAAGSAAPVAKPGSTIGASNPAAGQPNHMSPEMQAQLKRYQGEAKK